MHILTVQGMGGDGPEGIQGLDLSTYETTLAGGVSGAAVLPGDPESSLMIQKQNGEIPHFGQMNTEELDLVIQWIAAGALDK